MSPMPHSDHRIVLTGPSGGLRAEHLWRVDPDGREDASTEASVDGDEVSAFSRSCERIKLDLATGQERSRTFTK